ncbi:MAG: hypothetical protein IKS41_01620 [Alphaproteobacteria bacterium]|nr:hypothetical protein [Alphaproteobacteria bacterium]
MEKTPNFVERVQKFLPTPLYMRDGSICFSFLDGKADIFGKKEPLTSLGRERMTLGVWEGTSFEWTEHSIFSKEEGWQKYWKLNDDQSLGTRDEIIRTLFEEKFDKLFTIKEWKKCRKFYAQEYEAKKKTLEVQNPVWNKLTALDSEDVKKVMSDKQMKAMRNLYEAKLKDDPDYQALQELKQDVFALDTYISYREKEKERDSRDGLKQKLKDLTDEYASPEIKEVFPDEKQRLAVRGTLHKKLKRDART